MVEVIDGKDTVLGRLASRAAKLLLQEKDVFVINANHIVISGDPKVTVAKYEVRRKLKNKANPEHSPHWPRKPELLVKRVIRGMLPFRQARGRQAFKRLRVFQGIPEGVDVSSAQKMDARAGKQKLSSRFMSVQELCKRLGYHF